MVKVLESKVFWMDDYANYPSVHIMVSPKPEELELLYEEKDCYYFAEAEGVVSFFYYAQPSTGYGGRTFTLNMKDGSTKDLKGLWSGNSRGAARAGFQRTVYVDIGGIAYHITVPLAIKVCKHFNANNERKIGLALVNDFIWWVEVVTTGEFRLKGGDAEITEVIYKPAPTSRKRRNYFL